MEGMEGALSGVDRYSRALRTDADAEEETGDEQMGPRVGDALPDASGEGEKGADEDRPPTAQPFVKLLKASEGGGSKRQNRAYRVCKPTANKSTT